MAGQWVWNGRDWVQDPNGTQGGPHYDYGWTKQDGSIPYYGVDISSMLAQLGFPGAAAGQTFGSMVLEPERQRAIQQMLQMQTQSGANNAADNYQKALTGGAMGRAQQMGASLYGPGGGSKNFQASALLSQMNQANSAGAGYRAQVADPMNVARNRYATIMQGFNNPMANAVGQWLPGVEQQRQNNNFWGQLAGAASNIIPYLNFGGGKKNGLGNNNYGDRGDN